MPQELVYTSVPQGLARGSRGFTTVACSADLTPPAISRLESRSCYKPAFGLGDPNARHNPVLYAFRHVRLGNRAAQVLTRSAPVGTDYSGRGNTFTHHLILRDEELTPAGPAWLCARTNVFRTSWVGSPRQIEEDETILPGDDPPGEPAAHWERVTGDAGWGGALAAAHYNAPTTPIYLLYKPGTDLLPLIAESMSVLPPEERWRATFSTYWTGGAAEDVACRWRGVLAGGPGESSIPRKAQILDLRGPMTRPLPGPATDAARAGFCWERGTGVAPRGRVVRETGRQKVASMSATTATPPILPGRAGLSPTDAVPVPPSLKRPPSFDQPLELDEAAAPPPLPPGATEDVPSSFQSSRAESADPASRWPLVIAAMVMVALAIVIIGWAIQSDDDHQESPGDVNQVVAGTEPAGSADPITDITDPGDSTGQESERPTATDPAEAVTSVDPDVTTHHPTVVNPTEPPLPTGQVDPLVAARTEGQDDGNPEVPGDDSTSPQVTSGGPAASDPVVPSISMDPNAYGLRITGVPLVDWTEVNPDAYPQRSVFRFDPKRADEIDLGVVDELRLTLFLGTHSHTTYRLQDNNAHLLIIARDLPQAQRVLGGFRFRPDVATGRVAAEFTPGSPDGMVRLAGLRIGLTDQNGRLLLLAVAPPESASEQDASEQGDASGNPSDEEALVISPIEPSILLASTFAHQRARLVLRRDAEVRRDGRGRLRFGEDGYVELGRRPLPGRSIDAPNAMWFLRAELSELLQLRKPATAGAHNELLAEFQGAVGAIDYVEIVDRFDEPVQRKRVYFDESRNFQQLPGRRGVVEEPEEEAPRTGASLFEP